MKRSTILIIGGDSRIAQKFVTSKTQREKLLLTTRRGSKTESTENWLTLNLASVQSIQEFLAKVKNVRLDGAIFFVSLYEPLSKPFEIDDIARHLQINFLNQLLLLKHLQFSKGAKVIFLVDAGSSQPKRHFLGYSFSKSVLQEFIKQLAVEFAPQVCVLGVALGPISTSKTGVEKLLFHQKALLHVQNPVTGLVHLIRFLMHEPDLFTTGSIIPFDGGTYIKRSTGHKEIRMV